MLQGSVLIQTDSLDHEPILKISEIKDPASSAPLEAAELGKCSLNRLVSIPARCSNFVIHPEMVLLHTPL